MEYSVNIRKPALVAKLLGRSLSSKILRRPRLRYVDLCITTACNLNCRHCFAKAFKNTREGAREVQKELSLAEWGKVVRLCKESGAFSFGITGGEPLLYRELPDLIKTVSPEDTYISVNSNGTLFTDSIAQELSSAGVDAMLFSIDTADARAHDAFRGQDQAFRRTLEALDIARRHKMKVCVVCTLSHASIRDSGVAKLIDLTRQKRVMLILSRAALAGNWCGEWDMLLDEEDQRLMYDLVRRHPHVRTDFETNILKSGCGAGTEKIYVTPYGDVLPCPFLHISFGNIFTTPIEKIRQRIIARLGFYAQKCYAAENREFIQRYLSKTFDHKSLITEEECFGD